MKHIPPHIQDLIQKYFDGIISLEEKQRLNEWYRSFSANDADILEEEADNQVRRRVLNRLQPLLRQDNHGIQMRQVFLRAAAIFLLIAGSVATYILMKPSPVNQIAKQPATPSPESITPGGNKAILTLSDGSTIMLDNASNGSIGKQGDTKIIKTADGMLEYKDAIGIAHKTAYNTVVTPRGGQYKIELSDGTNVWLNASSSLRFPVAFDGSTREVEATGEVYFEVAKNPKKPFRVKLKDGYINVLGTHFNVMAYENEQTVNTTLLEGALSVTNDKTSRLLKPGQKAESDANGRITVNNEDSPENDIAWVHGKFSFHSADIRNIMRQVERWYDAEVVFEKDINLHFTGELKRSEDVMGLLRKLELTNEVHFKINKKRITVMP